MENLLEDLVNLLQKDERLVDDKGAPLKNKIVELALKLDQELIELLLADKQMKEVFFAQVGKAMIFDKDKFVKFVSNKQFLPDSYTAFKNKIGLIDEKGEFISEKKEVVLSWPYKDCVLEGGMTKEEQKRDEIFWNEILAPDEITRLLDPKVFTNAKRIDAKGEHKLDKFKTDEKGDPEGKQASYGAGIKDNLIIKGNNLLALHSLKKRFAGKVKLIYIDPPFNTGNDSFRYNDSFNHSSWLCFMRNRLEIARQLLNKEGIIFVHIDNEEMAYLKVLMDEIFGRDNFLTQISWERSPVAGLGQGGKLVVNVTEYILSYAREKINLKINNDFLTKKIFEFDKLVGYNQILIDEGTKKLIKEFISKSNREPVKVYKHENYKISRLPIGELEESRAKFKTFYKNNFHKIFRTFLVQKENVFQHELIAQMDKGLYSVEYTPSRGKSKRKLIRNFYLNKELCGWLASIASFENGIVYKFEKPNDFWTRDDVPFAARGEGGVKGEARTIKPEGLLYRLIKMTTEEADLVLDFFAGTGTTCAVAHKMGRQYIGIEQLDYGENSAVVRLKNVINGDQTGISKEVGWQGGGDFVYLELMKWNENFRDEIKKAKSGKELQKLWETMKEKAHLSYKVDIAAFDKAAKDFADLSLENQKRFLLECLDKNHLYVNYSEIDDEEYGVSEEDKKRNREFYEG